MALILAIVSLAVGTAVNPITLARTQTVSAASSSPIVLAIVVIFQVMLIGFGIFLLIWKPHLHARVLALVFSLLLSLFCAEISFRFYLFGRQALSFSKMNSVNGTGTAGIIQPSRHPEIVYELRPGLDTSLKLARFKTNSQGLRDAEYSVAKPGNTFRVAVVGDSLTMPAGVEIEDAYHSLLERRLNRNRKGPRYEFINFGVGGYCLRQYAAVVVHKVAPYDPDLILMGFTANDHRIPRDVIFERTFRPRKPTYPFFGSFLLRRFHERLWPEIRVHFSRGPPWQAFNQSELEYVRKWFSSIADFSSRNQIPVVVAVLSNINLPADYLERLREIAEANKLHFLDVSREFVDLNRSDYMIYPIDYHPNDKAQVIFADRIHEHLWSQGLLPSPP